MDSEHSVWRRGPFYEAWAYEDESALKVSATWKENPRMPEGFIERVRGVGGMLLWSRNSRDRKSVV